MAAKIKERNPHGNTGLKNKPRGVNSKDFERVYWPFLPVIIAATILIGLSAHTGSLASYIKHPIGKVLSYATSVDSNALLAATNAQRQVYDSPTLTLNSELTQAAQAKAQDMVARDYWSHNTPDGREPWTFVTATGYQYSKLGENLAAGFNDEQSVIKAWMASPAHKENLIDPSYTEVGFGFANSSNFTAAGGAQMTIVVAFYGRPVSMAFTVPSTISTNLAPSTANTTTAKTLAASTTRSTLAFSKTSASAWGPAVVLICIVGLVGLIVNKHAKLARKALRRSERYIWKHPLADLLVLAGVAILVVLYQTAGYIQ